MTKHNYEILLITGASLQADAFRRQAPSRFLALLVQGLGSLAFPAGVTAFRLMIKMLKK